MTRVKFVRPTDATFRSTLLNRVDAYFKETGHSKHGDWRMYLKTLLYVGGYFALYAWLVSVPHTVPAFLGVMAIIGATTAAIGLNIAHDASHGGYSARAWVNELVSHSFTIIGVHVYTWKIIHNVIHHTYTNIPGADGDLETVPMLRYYDKATPAKPYHRFQHLYAFGLYCLATMVWVFRKDYVHMNKKEHCGYVKPTPPFYEWVLLYFGKGLHYTLFLAIPWLVLEQPLGAVVLGFFLLHMVAGLVLATIFAVGHLVDDALVVPADAAGQVHDEWSAHQLRTTANFGTKSAFFYWTVGGLNFQIEHHLFPTICHVHYKALSPIVQATAKEYGLPYTAYASLPQALGAHMRYLRRYSQPPTEALGAFS
jgi:linoleoyl-CoA desaturase